MAKDVRFDGLPYEPDSASELLAATHLFTVEITGLAATLWLRGADGLEHRLLTISARLLDLLKGHLDVEPLAAFELTVGQQRESEFIETDYHGLWSHAEPVIGLKYLVIAAGDSTDPAFLMQEESCHRLADETYSEDVQLALKGEKRFQAAQRKRSAGSAYRSASAALLSFGVDQRQVARDLFARYLWSHISAAVLDVSKLRDQLLELVAAADAALDLRTSLIADLYEAVLMRDDDADLLRAVLRKLFSVLQQPQAGPFVGRLVDLQLYNLVFHHPAAPGSAADVLPDAGERAAVLAQLEGMPSERAQQLRAWIAEG